MRTIDKSIELLNRLIIRAYKMVGFVILLAIMSGLVSFFAIHLFYLIDRSWLAPVILSPSHERVVEISAQIAQQSYQRDRLVSERRQVDSDSDAARGRLELQRTLLSEYERLASSALQTASSDQEDLGTLARKVDDRRQRLSRERLRFEHFMTEELEAQRSAGLIVESDAVRLEHQLSELGASEIALDREETEIGMEMRQTDVQRAALSRLAREFAGGSSKAEVAALTPGLVDLKRGYEEARLEARRLEAQLEEHEHQARLLEETIARYDRLLRELNESPYLQALDGEVTIAFVPYDNLPTVSRGAPVYGCLLYLVGCRRVGEIVDVVDGEVSARHPLTDDPMRGLMVEVDLSEGRWAQDEALFAGGRPFWLL